MTISAIDELKLYPNWVCWREQPHPTKVGKFKKPIISAVTGTNGSHTNRADWTTYQKAKAFYITNKTALSLKGLGFVFSDDTPFVGIDIDDCVENGQINEFATRQLNTFKSYSEFSYSGTGVHILGKSDLKFPAITTIKNGKSIEIYSQSRYFVVTGQQIEGTPDEILDISRPLSYRVSEQQNESQTTQNSDVTIQQVIEMLGYIPGEGLDYNEWVRILMSVHSKFPGGDGLAAVSSWTGRFCLPNELEQKWKSFRAGGINIGTLVYFAKEYGYTHTPFVTLDGHLDRIQPKLTETQREQVQRTIEIFAEKRAWELYNEFLVKHNIDIGYPQNIIEHFQLGYRGKTVDHETGLIIPGAITVPYYSGTEVVGIEYREEEYNEYSYDGAVGLFRVKPIIEEDTKFGLVLPDSFNAINTYVSGMGIAAIFGLPHTQISLELPDMDLYCIFDDTTPIETLETLADFGTKFTKVRSIKDLLDNMPRQDIERLATRGKTLKGII